MHAWRCLQTFLQQINLYQEHEESRWKNISLWKIVQWTICDTFHSHLYTRCYTATPWTQDDISDCRLISYEIAFLSYTCMCVCKKASHLGHRRNIPETSVSFKDNISKILLIDFPLPNFIFSLFIFFSAPTFLFRSWPFDFVQICPINSYCYDILS